MSGGCSSGTFMLTALATDLHCIHLTICALLCFGLLSAGPAKYSKLDRGVSVPELRVRGSVRLLLDLPTGLRYRHTDTAVV